MKKLDPNAKLLLKDDNNFRFLTYDEINHKDIMRFYVRECVEDKLIRKQLFNILRRDNYVDVFIDELHKCELYEDFDMIWSISSIGFAMLLWFFITIFRCVC